MITRRNLIALPGAVALAGGLAACGGGKSTKAGNVRLVNATSYASIDLRVSNTNIIAAVAKGAASGYVDVDEGTTAFQVGENGSTSTLLTQSDTVSNNTNYTMVAYTTNSTLNAAYFSDTEGAPTSGTAKIRLFNAAAEAGALDVYVVAAGLAANIGGATATNSNVAAQRVGAYTEKSAGSWDIVVTGTGDTDDVRLTLSSVTLKDQQVLTLVVTATDGGVLVNSLLIDQGSTVTAAANSTVRLRVVADLTNAGKVVVTSTTSSFNLTSPSIGSYKATPVDLTKLTISVGGTTLSAAALSATAGSDVTLLVHGDAAAPQVLLIQDTNRLPTSTSKTNVRLLHGLNDLSSTLLSFNADFTQLDDSVAYAAMSKVLPITVSSEITFQVYASGSSTALYDNSSAPATLASQAVYTLFLLGNSSAPTARLSRDR